MKFENDQILGLNIAIVMDWNLVERDHWLETLQITFGYKLTNGLIYNDTITIIIVTFLVTIRSWKGKR